ncbi:MAG: copper chaperone PCu(A)C [Chromatiales bacterium]|nr:copper chaperone PCu(A)C [Chromatiales bacterium]
MLLLFATSAFVHAGDKLVITDPWIREMPPGAAASAGYMKIMNHGESNRILVGAESPDFETVMLHRTVMEGELSKMVHQPTITLPARGTVELEPNSYHLMMMKPKRALVAGDKVVVTLKFKDGDSQEVEHHVRADMGGMKNMNHGHNHGHGHNSH